jgi:cytosol alanyl aminopeptidase
VSVRGAIGVVVLLVASVASASPAPAPAPGPSFWPAPPGLRLPEGVTPLAYDVRLEVNPDDPVFRGHVEITTQLAARTDVIWLHAVGLALTSASFREGANTGTMRTVPGTEEMIGLRLDRSVGPGEIVLVVDYTGALTTKSEGLFRQRSGGKWFVYSQSESIFARRFVPCFDEPRFKPAWRVTTVVPGEAVALANAPVAREQRLADGRREVTFAELGPMPSYLLAIAVGPFSVVDAGTVGRARIPVRIVVPPEDAKRVTIARRTLPAVVAALERYLDRPLPWPKLDLVGVPMFSTDFSSMMDHRRSTARCSSGSPLTSSRISGSATP